MQMRGFAAGLVLTWVMAATPAWTQLQGEYYDGPTLGGYAPADVFAIVYSHLDAPIDFKVAAGNQWYLGTSTNRVHDPDDPGLPGTPAYPAAYVGPSDFCVRWRGQIKVPTAGDYTFYLTVKDGVRFYLDNIDDGQSIGPDHWAANGLQTYQYTITGLPAGRHPIRMDYVNRTGTAEARLAWAGPGIAQEIIPAANLLPPAQGLVGEYYNHYDASWNFNLFPPPIKTRYDRAVDWWWGYASDLKVEELIQYDYFSVVWKGMIDLPVTSNYRFRLDYLDDNGYLKIDGATLIADDGQPGVVYPGLTRESYWKGVQLDAGKHRIEVGLREITGDAGCRLSWWRTGQGGYSVIPTTALFPYLQPTDITLSNAQVPENSGPDALIGVFSTLPAGAEFAYALVAGTGDTDNSLFYRDGDALYAVSNLNFEDPHGPAYNIRVQSTDLSSSESIARTFAITVSDVNDAPTALLLDNDTIYENAGVNAEVGDLSATDEDAEQAFFYSLVPGVGDTDNDFFNMQGNTLRASAGFDYETRQTYSVRIQVQDNGVSPLACAQAFTVHVLDVVEPPTGIALSNSTVNENAGGNAVLGDFSTLGPGSGAYTYLLVPETENPGYPDNKLFNIEGNTLRAVSSFDYETRASYSILVRSTDNAPPYYAVEQAFSLGVVNVNEAPVSVELTNASVYENAGPDAVAGALYAADADLGQSHTFTLVAGAGDGDNGAFNIIGGMLRTNLSFDFETRQTYQIRVRATDNGTPPLFVERGFTIHVMDVIEPILSLELSNNRIDENAGADAVVGVLTTEGQETGYDYALAPGDGSGDNASFNISGNQLRATASFNYEAQTEYSIRVRSEEAAAPENSYERAFSIFVRDVNEPPTDLTLSNNALMENTGPNAIVGVLSTADADQGQIHSYALVEGAGDADNTAFNIDGAALRITANADYEIKQTYRVRIRVQDSGVPAMTAEQAFVITILDQPEPGAAIRLSNTFLVENAAADAAVGTLSVSAGGVAPFTYALAPGLGGEDNASFQIAGAELHANAIFDFEARAVYSVRVRCQDSAEPPQVSTEVFAIRVLDVNEAPNAVQLSQNALNENAGVNAVIGALSTTDPDTAQIHFYALVPGVGDAHNGLFNINGALLRASGNLDYETGAVYSVRVQSIDSGGLTCETPFTIEVRDVNEAPSGIALTNNLISENAPAGTAVGSFTSLDPDTGQSHSYALVAGPGSADNLRFSIAGDELRANAPFDFEYDAIYSVRVRTTDNGNPALAYSQSFLITVENLNEAPRAILLSNRFVPISAGPGTYVGSFSTLDPDTWSNQQHTYALVTGEGGTHNGYFELSDNKLYTGPLFDPGLGTFSIRVRSTDNGTNPDSLSFDEVFSIVAGEEASQTLQVDFVRPLDATAPEYLTANSTVRFLVSFNKAVTGVETAAARPPEGFDDFAPIMGGNIEGALVQAVMGEGPTYIVHVSTGDHDGLLGLEVRHDGGCAAQEGGQSLAAPYTAGPPYLVDKTPLFFSRQPEDASKLAGQEHTFYAEVQGAQGTPHYHWKRGDVLLGDDLPQLTLGPLAEADAGFYYCEAYDDWEAAVSEPARLEVHIGVPVAGTGGLAALAGLAAIFGAVFLRRNKTGQGR